LNAILTEPDFKRDLMMLEQKCPTIRKDVTILTRLIQERAVFSKRCQELIPDLVFLSSVSISGLPFHEAEDRCTMVWELYGRQLPSLDAL
jgi:hypothetical protein